MIVSYYVEAYVLVVLNSAYGLIYLCVFFFFFFFEATKKRNHFFQRPLGGRQNSLQTLLHFGVFPSCLAVTPTSENFLLPLSIREAYASKQFHVQKFLFLSLLFL